MAGAAGGGAAGAPAVPDTKETLLAKLDNPCTDALGTFYDPVTTPAAWTEKDRGNIARCAYEKVLTKAELDAFLGPKGVSAASVTDVHKLRIVYMTEGADGLPVATSGSLYVPAVRKGGDAAPVVVFGHGTVGLADKCAPSREEDDASANDWRTLVYGLSGAGFSILMPDYPGLGMANAHAWMFSSEEAHTLLDATRAARKLAKPGLFGTKNAVLGHSQGGHAALSAQSMATTYGTEGTVDAWVTYAPFWISNAAWGAALHSIGESIAPTAFGFAAYYFYGHGARLDGEAQATSPFLPAKADMMKQHLETTCLPDLISGSQKLGITKSSELFTDTFRTAVGGCGLLGSCGDPLAAKWKDRWIADRPHLDPKRSVVLWQGGMDTTVEPGRAMCGVDRMKADGVELTVCTNADATHSGILASAQAWSVAYLGEKLVGGPAAAACGAPFMLPACSTPPANGTGPMDP